ncbi:tetratricopeptide repeat protein [Streptomyces formicae]|uniref:Putative ATP/GTP binding protein n=1 Tax=Streptomyces formicae TaxID=1616117 RepID=A0A291Q5I9_9ACTN|nr:tetratricopeptide repeat protein [Streptomyces formicae]ATL26872.1 putative ATP/GTP binding protein [Streptomyces formicae]
MSVSISGAFTGVRKQFAVTRRRFAVGIRRLATGTTAVSALAIALMGIIKEKTSGPVLVVFVALIVLAVLSLVLVARPAAQESATAEGAAVRAVPPNNLPFRSRYFVGRKKEMARLERTLRPEKGPKGRRVSVVHGTGGVGKSQLATAYAHGTLAEHSLTRWLNATSPDRLLCDLLELATLIGITYHESKTVVLTRLWSWLRDHPDWLLVYDNVQLDGAEQPDEGPVDHQRRLQPLLPPEGVGEILITTQLREGWTGLCPDPVELTVYDEEDGLAFLRKRTGSTADERLRGLGRQLGWQPLALEQAGAYIEQAEIGVEDEDFEEYLRRLSAQSADSDAKTFELAIERIGAQQPAAEDLMRLCSFLASEDVPRATLFRYRSVLPDRLRLVMDDQLAFTRLVLKLVDHSLMTRHGDGRTEPVTYGIHPRVQIFIRSRLTGHERLEWSQAAVRLIEAAFPLAPDQLESRVACDRLMPHVDAVTAEPAWAADNDGELGAARDPEALVRLLHRAGSYQNHRCEWKSALAYFAREAELRGLGTGSEQCLATAHLAIARQHYLLAHLDTAEAACGKALALCDAHKDDDAFQQVRAQCCRQFGGILRERNRFREASGYLEAALRIYELQGSGWEVIDWAVTEQEAGMIHRNAGRHIDALDCYERAGDLVGGGGSTGLEEHVVFRAMLRRDVGIVAQDRGDLDTAERELTAAHEVFRTKRGEEDFETAQVAKFLADVLRRKGQQCKAASRRTRNPLRKRTLRAQAQAHLARAHELLCPVLALLGKRRTTEAHTYAACLNKLGSLQWAQGHLHRAIDTLREAEEIYVTAYGPDHHYRAKTLSRLGPVLRAAGDREGAERELRTAERIFVASLGEDHPSLVAVYEFLADCATDPAEAGELRARATRIHRSLWGKSSPS